MCPGGVVPLRHDATKLGMTRARRALRKCVNGARHEIRARPHQDGARAPGADRVSNRVPAEKLRSKLLRPRLSTSNGGGTNVDGANSANAGSAGNANGGNAGSASAGNASGGNNSGGANSDDGASSRAR
jgi:hypothetical protein